MKTNKLLIAAAAAIGTLIGSSVSVSVSELSLTINLSAPINVKTSKGESDATKPMVAVKTAAKTNNASVGELALLEFIAKRESRGDYHVMYRGKRVADLSKHPNRCHRIISGPNVGKCSTAAGKYQFIIATWNRVAAELGLEDFSPASQDAAALYLARSTYANATGSDLTADLENADRETLAIILTAMATQWTSVPGGIEQTVSLNRAIKELRELKAELSSRLVG